MSTTKELSESEMYELKMKAVQYYNENKVAENLEEVLNKIIYENPNDVYGRLAKFFDHLSNPPAIKDVTINSTLDGSGNTAIECDLICEFQNEIKSLAKFPISLSPELLILPPVEDGNDEITAHDVANKCKEFSREILKTIMELNPVKQKEVDSVLRDWINAKEVLLKTPAEPKVDNEAPRTPTPSSGKKKKGASAKKGKGPDKIITPKQAFEFRAQGCSIISALSLANALGGATYRQLPLFCHIHNLTNDEENKQIKLPVCGIAFFNGGKLAPGKLNLAKNIYVFGKSGMTYEDSLPRLVQLFQQIGKSAAVKTAFGMTGPNGGFQITCEKVEQLLDMIQDAATILELPIEKYFAVGIDCSAADIFDYDKGKYEIVTGAMKSPDELVEYYKDLLTRYPHIQFLFDPLRKEDQEQYFKLCEAVSEKCLVVGGPSVFGSLHELTEAELQTHVTTGVLLQCGGRLTLTDITSAMQTAHEYDKVTIISNTAPDVCTNHYADVAVGLSPDIALFGGPSRGEFVARINRLLEIEKFCKKNSMKVVHSELQYPVIKSPEEPISEEMKEAMVTPASSQKNKKK